MLTNPEVLAVIGSAELLPQKKSSAVQVLEENRRCLSVWSSVLILGETLDYAEPVTSPNDFHESSRRRFNNCARREVSALRKALAAKPPDDVGAVFLVAQHRPLPLEPSFAIGQKLSVVGVLARSWPVSWPPARQHRS